MQPALEDLFLGPLATPSLSQEIPFPWEDGQRRVRVIFAGLTVADSTHVMRLMDSLRILIADDHPLFRKGMRALLTATVDTEVIGEATTGQEVIELAAMLQAVMHRPFVQGTCAFPADRCDLLFAQYICQHINDLHRIETVGKFSSLAKQPRQLNSPYPSPNTLGAGYYSSISSHRQAPRSMSWSRSAGNNGRTPTHSHCRESGRTKQAYSQI